MNDFSVVADKDMRLLQAVFRVAREGAEELSGAGDNRLERALDEFDLRASFRIPPA